MKNGYVIAMVHSKEAKEEVKIIKYNGNTDWIVMTKDGVKCHAIYNAFAGCYYADDLYATYEVE